MNRRWKEELKELGIWSFSFSADSVLRILYRVISRFLSKVKQIPDILLLFVFMLLDYVHTASIRGSLVILAAVITIFMVLMISWSLHLALPSRSPHAVSPIVPHHSGFSSSSHVHPQFAVLDWDETAVECGCR